MPRKFKISIAILAVFCLIAGVAAWHFLPAPAAADNVKLDEQAATINAINKAMPAVVSIVVYDQELVAIVNRDGTTVKNTQEVAKGSGTGFLISADGLILTNKHVVEIGDPATAEFRISLNNKKQYYAKLIGKDPLNDLAVLKIFDKNLPYLEMGASSRLPIGTTVMAIGNALGHYNNSVTKGIVSGLNRDVTASGPNGLASLANLIQTDAQISEGNSGGPLINLDGKVVGINVAVDNSGNGLSFAIPIDDARSVVDSVRRTGRIIRVRLGVRYLMLDSYMAAEKKINRDSGALIANDVADNQPAVLPDSPASKADIREGDVIFEINGAKIDNQISLLSLLQQYHPGDKVTLKIQRGKDVLTKIAVLDEFKAAQ